MLAHLDLALTQHLRQLGEEPLVALDGALELPGEEDKRGEMSDTLMCTFETDAGI